MPPGAFSLPPIIQRVRRWKNDRRHPPHEHLIDPPPHRRDTRAQEVAKHLNQALAFPHLLAQDRGRFVRKIPELDLQRRAELTPLPIDRRCSVRTQDVSPHSLFPPPVAVPGAHRVRTPRGRQPRLRLRELPCPLSY